jgi:hypothetical protein
MKPTSLLTHLRVECPAGSDAKSPGASLVSSSTRVRGQEAVCPPHEWGCPVIMELDPEHVAWTCARCGAIATSDDRSVRPA